VGEVYNDASIMAALGRQLTQSVQKQTVAASNLANLDTPDYRTKEVNFSDALDAELRGGVMTVTNSKHLGGPTTGAVGGASTAEAAETPNLPLRRDGNNVQLDRELLAMTKAAADFSAAQTVLAAKFRLVRYAINEGR
jgi:flagellar basal-body rod protein FlgB